MEVKVRYEGRTASIPITPKTSINQLITASAKEFNLTQSNVRLIFKGKKIAKVKDKLINLGITNNSKILLMISEKPKKEKKIDKKRAIKGITEDIPPPIVEKGPPPGCAEGLSVQVSKFPKDPFPVYTSKGTLAKISIESNAVFVMSDEPGECERLFDIEIRNTPDIKGYEGSYISITMNTSNGMRSFYYIPRQYTQLIKEHFQT